MAKQFGKWEIVKPLPEGGQAHTYVVRDTTEVDQPLRVLKRLKNIKRLDRFQRETEALMKLGANEHGIPAILDQNLEAEYPYFVLDYFPRGDLEHSGVHAWATEARLDLFLQVVQSLSLPHLEGIVHRDVKPGNILVADDGSPRLVDFGLCYFEQGVRLTLTEEVAGPRYYTAPELEGGRSDRVTPAADVYSLGKVLYWLCSEQHLPRERHREGEYDLVRLKGEPRYELVSKFIDRCLQLAPEERFPNAAGMIEATKLLIEQFRSAKNVPGSHVPQRCIYCGLGEYQVAGTQRPDGGVEQQAAQRAAGITVYDGRYKRVMRCDHCGNVQVFDLVAFARGKVNPWALHS